MEVTTKKSRKWEKISKQLLDMKVKKIAQRQAVENIEPNKSIPVLIKECKLK